MFMLTIMFHGQILSDMQNKVLQHQRLVRSLNILLSAVISFPFVPFPLSCSISCYDESFFSAFSVSSRDLLPSFSTHFSIIIPLGLVRFYSATKDNHFTIQFSKRSFLSL